MQGIFQISLSWILNWGVIHRLCGVPYWHIETSFMLVHGGKLQMVERY